jgi:hypothetical protein
VINIYIFGDSFQNMRQIGHGKTWQYTPYPLVIIGKTWLCSTYVLTRWLHAVFIYTKKNNEAWHDAKHEWQESANLKKLYQLTY